MSKPFIVIRQISGFEPPVHMVAIHLTAQSAADVLEVMKQCTTACCDANLDQSAFNELMRQLQCLTGLPDPSRC